MSPVSIPAPIFLDRPVMERRTFLAMVSGSVLAAPLAAAPQEAGKDRSAAHVTPRFAVRPPPLNGSTVRQFTQPIGGLS
jgi:hypothetical protein